MRVALLLIVSCLFSFAFGVVLGVGGYAWQETGGIVPPAPQDTSRIELSVAKWTPENQWLDKVHFQIVPMPDVKSPHQYFMILMTPPSEGLQVNLFPNVELYLTASGESTVQPFEIRREEFGPKGDQPVLKLIEGGITIGAHPDFKVSDGAP